MESNPQKHIHNIPVGIRVVVCGTFEIVLYPSLHSLKQAACAKLKDKFPHLCQGGCEHVGDVADYADHGEADEDDHPKPQEDVDLKERLMTNYIELLTLSKHP